MRKRVLILLCGIALLLCACIGQGAERGQPPKGAYGVYYAVSASNRGSAAVDCEYRTLEEGAQPVPALMELLLAQPENLGLSSPFPTGVRLLSWQLEEGQLHLDLSEQYGGLSGVALTVADYCIALTLCQVEGVERVYITVEGDEMPFRRTQQLSADDVVLSGAEEEAVHVRVSLWFPRSQGDGLGVEYRQVTRTEEHPLREAVLAAWLSGPEYQSLTTSVPEDTQIRSVELENGICYVNLSEDFLSGLPSDSAQRALLVYALVNTMGSLDSVAGVQLLVEGEAPAAIGGVDTSQPLIPDLSLEKN